MAAINITWISWCRSVRGGIIHETRLLYIKFFRNQHDYDHEKQAAMETLERKSISIATDLVAAKVIPINRAAAEQARAWDPALQAA